MTSDLLRALRDQKYGHLPRRMCTKDEPMPQADKDLYRWSHQGAVVLGPYFNLVRAKCPNCGMTFLCPPL